LADNAFFMGEKAVFAKGLWQGQSNEQAFNQPAEANVVDKLRQTCFSLLSLVAEDDHRRVGPILFSPAVIDYSGRPIEGRDS